MRACPPTDRLGDATTASLLAPSEASSSFPTSFTRLTRASTVPALAHPQVGVSTVRSSSVAFLSFSLPSFSLADFHFSACSFRLSVARPHLSRTSSHILLTPGYLRSQLPTPATVSQITPLPPSDRWFPSLPRNCFSGYVTKSKFTALTVALLSRSSPGYFLCVLLIVALARPYTGVSADRPS